MKPWLRQGIWLALALIAPVLLSLALLPLRGHVSDVLIALVLLSVSAAAVARGELLLSLVAATSTALSFDYFFAVPYDQFAIRGAQVYDGLAVTLTELRDLSRGLHPAILVEAGLGPAVRALARRSPLPVRVQVQTDGRLPGSCEATAYYVAAEAFTNAAKHAAASAVDILIERVDGALTVQVRDDGVGGADATRGSGLVGMRDRVEAVGGTMTLDSPAMAGTVLTVRLPVTAERLSPGWAGCPGCLVDVTLYLLLLVRCVIDQVRLAGQMGRFGIKPANGHRECTGN